MASYWVVDPDARLVEIWHPDDDRPEIAADELRWLVAPEAGELAIGLAGLFRPTSRSRRLRRVSYRNYRLRRA